MFDQITLQIGDTAPELKLKDQHGNLVFLRDYAGRWVVLYFYPKDDTPGCTREACNFRDESERLAPFKVQVLGVSVDSRESHESFARKFKLNFPLLADPTKKITQSLRRAGFLSAGAADDVYHRSARQDSKDLQKRESKNTC